MMDYVKISHKILIYKWSQNISVYKLLVPTNAKPTRPIQTVSAWGGGLETVLKFQHFKDDSIRMGVRGLTSYVNSIETLWTRQTKLENTKLIIDGSGLCNYLYKNVFDCRCGGQYEEFYNAVLSFFSVLESNAVESFVVLDGAQHASGKKLETHKKRANQRIETSCALADNQVPENGEDFLLPLLSKLVFLQALRDLTSDHSVKFAVCDR